MAALRAKLHGAERRIPLYLLGRTHPSRDARVLSHCTTGGKSSYDVQHLLLSWAAIHRQPLGVLLTIKARIVCLANSHKKSFRCVAGIEFPTATTYRWIRPIGNRSGHGLDLNEIVLEDGTQPQPLDLIEIGLIDRRPDGHQQENYLLDINVSWRRIDRATWQQATNLPISSNPLWINGFNSGRGFNDFLPETQMLNVTDSLRLVRVRPTIRVGPSRNWENKLNVRASFMHAGEDYNLSVTDPVADDFFRAKGIGNYKIDDSILTISLGERFVNRYTQEAQYYKIVAAVIQGPTV